MSLRSREYSRTSSPRRWSWHRIPSYLSSTQTVGPSRRTISVASSAGDASMNLSGWNSVMAASPRRSSLASTAVRPMSPVSMPARFTASSGRSNALASAASSRPSRRPIRSSPDMTLTIAAAVRGPARRRSASSSPALAAAPWAASIATNASRVSSSVGSSSGDGACPASSRTAATASATSLDRSYARRSASASAPATRRTAPLIPDHPTPIVRWSVSGNGRPVRNTAATGSSSGVSVAR
jgi:hypothetical protein